MKKTPISIIIDDSTALCYVYYYHMPTPITKDGRPFPTFVPNSFMKRFCDIVEKRGVKGKFSIVPEPAGKGDIVRGIEGFSKKISMRCLLFGFGCCGTGVEGNFQPGVYFLPQNRAVQE